MKFSLFSTALFLCVVLTNRSFVRCSLRLQDDPKSSSNTKDEPSFASLAKVAFESDDPSFYKKTPKHDFSSLAELAHELEYLSNLKTTTEKNNFAALSKLAFELDDLKNPKKSKSDEFGSLTKAAYELDELSDFRKSSVKHDYASVAKLAFQLDDLSPYKKSDGHNYASLAKLAFESDVSPAPAKPSKKPTSDPAVDELKELFENLKFFATTTTTTFHNAKAGTLHLSFSDELRPLNDDQYNVEKELNLVDFYFRPSFNCEVVKYRDVTVWKKGDSDVKVPSTVTFDMDEKELVVRDDSRHVTYREMANGSWRLLSVEVFSTKDLYYDALDSELFKPFNLPLSVPLPLEFYPSITMMTKALNIYTRHGDNLIMTNNLAAYELDRIGKFRSIYVFKFHASTKCVGVEFQGRRIWSRELNDDTPLLDDECTKEYPLRVVFNTRSNAVYVMFRNTYFVCVRQLHGFFLFKVNLLKFTWF
nr:hypothetical protein MACL_00003323 [Theileria orientalis]